MSECVLSENWWKITSEEEFKKNKRLKKSDIDFIQEWMKKQPHLPALNVNQLIMFLRACDYSLEKSKETIDLNYTMRTKHPEFFSHRDFSRNSLLAAMQFLEVGILPERVNDQLVVCGRVKEIDLSKLFIDDYIKYCLMATDMSHLEYGSAEGYIYILDFEHVTFSLVLRLPIPTAVVALKFLQYGTTCRIRGLHIVNPGQVFEKAFAIFQPFLKAEIVNLIMVHSDYESLRNVVNPKSLPSDYGGYAESVDELNQKTQKHMLSYKDWFLKEELQKVNEKKRPSDSPSDYGMQGSFRKLDID